MTMAEEKHKDKEEVPSSNFNSIVLRLALTSTSAIVAETCTFPIDITKTRLQLQHSRKGSLQTAMGIVQEEGLTGLYKGLPPALIRHIFYTTIRILSYEQLRNRFLEQSDHVTVLNRALIGGISGILGQVREFSNSFYNPRPGLPWSSDTPKTLLSTIITLQVVASPADLIKVRMQADGCMGLKNPRYSGFADAIVKIIRADGVSGLWTGVLPNVQRAFLVNMGELACYDQAKRTIVGCSICDDNVYAHTLASMMSGLCATTLSCPADVVKTRMMNQAGEEYRGSLDCVVKTVRKEGLKAMWKGFFPTWARLGPWQFVFWVSYEKFRSLTGLSSF
ncbi:hypothetical protein KI387_038255 [Taxus chinensis]|uniref:Uncoupling protein 3 n=1 Tax=Taxus chinensis TaxID=29808 RepID=A0AA38CD21_TAXCH|nr:hypothetical protein KI387_038255 [Taxus chinensis]